MKKIKLIWTGGEDLAKLSKSKVGWKVITVDRFEMIEIIKGAGVCDCCGSDMQVGKLIPVLNAIYCSKCYVDFDESTRFYPEDVGLEESVFKYYQSILRFED